MAAPVDPHTGSVGTYSERASNVTGSVVWQRAGAPDEARVDPDGCMDLIWTGDGLLVAGPDTRSHIAQRRHAGEIVGLRFGPGIGPAIFSISAHALRDQRVPLDAVWPSAEVRSMTDRVGGAADRSSAMETIAVDRLRRHGPPDQFAADVVSSLRAGLSVGEIAEAVSFSERQLHRRCLAAFGYGAKTLARVLRFRRALELTAREPSFGTVAALAGYADQAHLAREAKALTGVPLSQLRR